MSPFTAVTEGLTDDVEAWDGPTQEDWDWYFENSYVDPAERVG